MAADPLILTKLYIPRPQANLVSRPRLITLLNEGLQGKLTLISAPPGFGKTTLLGDWARQYADRVAWLTLDERDNDLARFLTYLIAALRTIDQEAGQSALEMLQVRGQSAYESILTSLINEIVATPAGDGQPQVLILDDYHLINVRAVHEAVGFLLDFLPPQLHLIIASRVDPELPLGRLRISGRLAEVRATDLRFTEPEIIAFFREVMGVQLSAGDIAALQARTEGWVAGLQVAALSMRDRDDISNFIQTFSGSNRYILEYLIEEVLARQPERSQRFLIQTAVLDRLSGPLCDAVVVGSRGNDEENEPEVASQVMLEQLEAANLFIAPLDNDRRWYRYHPLFAEFLRRHLRATQPDLIPLLHRRAARWLERNNQPAEAVSHALAAGDGQDAVRLAETAAKQMVMQGEWRTLQNWLDALPEDQVRGRPRLALTQAWVHLYSSSPDKTEAWLQEAETHLSPAAAPEKTGADLDRATTLRGEIAAIRATMAAAAGDMRRAIDLGRQALGHLPEEERFLRTAVIMAMGYAYRYSGDVSAAQAHFERVIALGQENDNRYQVLDGLCNLANQQLIQGRRLAAAQTAAQALQITESAGGKPSSIAAEVYLINGVLSYEKNDLETAGNLIERSLTLGKQAGMGELQYAANFWSGLVALGRGKPEEAIHYMDAAGRVVEQLNIRRAERHVAAGRVRLLLSLGDLAPVRDWVAEIEAAGDVGPLALAPIREFEGLTLVRAYLALGETEKALSLLGRLEPEAEAAGRFDHVVRMMALHALALAARGHTLEALDVLAHLLPLTAAEGYVRLYVDLGASMATLLHQAAAAGIEPGEARKLLAAFEVVAGPESAAAQTMAALLTSREEEVLALIAAGYTNKQIAGELVISLGTVKRHISNIYRKLGVRRRTQAVAKARELEEGRGAYGRGRTDRR